MKNVASNTIKSKTLIRLKDVCVNKEHRVLLSCCPITAIPALKVGHTCTACLSNYWLRWCHNYTSGMFRHCPDRLRLLHGLQRAHWRRLWWVTHTYSLLWKKKQTKKLTNKKHSATCSTWRCLCRSDSYPPTHHPPPNTPHTPHPRTTHPPLSLILVWSCAVEETLNSNKASSLSFNKSRLHK